MRYFLTSLMIAALLVCPYGCLAGMICGGADERPASACCGHCCHESSTDGDPAPAPEEHSPQSCVCKGALPDTGAFELLPPLENRLAELDGAAAVRPAEGWPAAHRLEHDRFIDHGCGLRIVLQSFLC